MKIGDRVKHSSGSFTFVGKLLGSFIDGGGGILWGVEQEGSKYIQLFGEHSLKVIDPNDWFEGIAPKVVPEPVKKPDFPIVIHIPERAVAHGSPQVNGYRSRIKLGVLPPRPNEALRGEFVKVEITYAFTGTIMGDIDNLTKPVLDLLKGSIIVDDRQVRELSCRMMPNQLVSKTTITITEYVPKTD